MYFMYLNTVETHSLQQEVEYCVMRDALEDLKSSSLFTFSNHIEFLGDFGMGRSSSSNTTDRKFPFYFLTMSPITKTKES